MNSEPRCNLQAEGIYAMMGQPPMYGLVCYWYITGRAPA